MQLKEVGTLVKGDAFGEVSLMYNSKRTATINAHEKSDLIVLEKIVFQKYIKDIQNLKLSSVLVFLE